MELLAVLGHFLVFVGRRISDNDDLVYILELAYPSNIVKQNLVSFVAQSSFWLDRGHERLQIARVL